MFVKEKKKTSLNIPSADKGYIHNTYHYTEVQKNMVDLYVLT